ncbi:MAG TPA: hypothetical protein VFZ66_03035 [Herpetosiphonaceae bacterium]
MSNATRSTVATFGMLAALAGIEHGIGEIVQGNRPPAAIVIESWPDSALFAIVSGEPAMTIVPNLLLTGILAIVVSLIFFVWATRFVQHTHGGLILMLLSIVLLLVGGGFGPPLLGIILGIAAQGIDAEFPWWRAHLPRGVQHVLSAAWPWSFGGALIAWLLVMPGSMLLDYFVGLNERTMYTFIFSAFGLLLLTIVTGCVRDMQRQPGVPLRPAMSG